MTLQIIHFLHFKSTQLSPKNRRLIIEKYFFHVIVAILYRKFYLNIQIRNNLFFVQAAFSQVMCKRPEKLKGNRSQTSEVVCQQKN